VLDACLVFSRNVPDPATVHEGILIEIEHQLLKYLDSTRCTFLSEQKAQSCENACFRQERIPKREDGVDPLRLSLHLLLQLFQIDLQRYANILILLLRDSSLEIGNGNTVA
jgi:hypothetical protein